MTEKPAQGTALVTAASAGVMWAGLGKLASTQPSVTLPKKSATRCARTLKMLSAPMQVHVTVAGASVIIQMEMDSFMVNFVSVMIENA